MANAIDDIPEKTRWEIATLRLTGACIAISNVLKQATGQKGTDEFNRELWYEAGKGAVESSNPDFTFKPTKNMRHGDPHCEWVVERKR